MKVARCGRLVEHVLARQDRRRLRPRERRLRSGFSCSEAIGLCITAEVVRLPLQIGGKVGQFALARLDRGRSLAIECTLAGRDLGYGLVERHLAIVLAIVSTVVLAIIPRRTAVDLFLEAVRPRERTIGGFAAALLATAFAADRRLRHGIATANVFVTLPAAPLPIVAAQAQVQLLIRFTAATAPIGVTRASVVVPLLGAEDRAPSIVRLALAIVRIGVKAGALQASIVGTEARPPLIVPTAIVTKLGSVRLPAILVPLVRTAVLARLIVRPALTPGGVAGSAILFSLREVCAAPIIRPEVAAAPVGIIAVAAALLIVGAEALAAGIVHVAIETGRRRELAILRISRLDHAVEPFADRHAGSPRGSACSLARLRTKTSQIPRTARFHAHVPNHMRSRMCPVFRADAASRRRGGRGFLSLRSTFQEYGKEAVKKAASRDGKRQGVAPRQGEPAPAFSAVPPLAEMG